MAVAQILPDKFAYAAWIGTFVDMFWCVIELMAVTLQILVLVISGSGKQTTHRCSALE